MAQTCTKCSRANPADAVYCYYDGFVLGGHSRNGGPVAVGAQAFSSPFVFPTGKTCRSFNELALACQDDWAAARDLLNRATSKPSSAAWAASTWSWPPRRRRSSPTPTAASTSS